MDERCNGGALLAATYMSLRKAILEQGSSQGQPLKNCPMGGSVQSAGYLKTCLRR